jgi:hypothetical protein
MKQIPPQLFQIETGDRMCDTCLRQNKTISGLDKLRQPAPEGHA